jgi:RHS repeat-associated protein
VELEILGGSATNSDGTPFLGKLSINPVPDYGRPESRPEELRPGMAVTIQPAGVRFNPAARLTFPNADGVPSGNEFNLWSLSPDTGTFNIVGKSAVSADGQSVITVEGGVTASAWHFPLAPSPEPVQDDGDDYCEECDQEVGSTANLKEGSVFSSHMTPSYRSLGLSRSVSLTYSSVAADPNPIVGLDARLSVRAAVPNSFSTRLLIGGVQQGPEIHTDTRPLPEDADSLTRLSHVFNAANLATGRYSYQATVFSNYQNSSIGGISNGNVIIVNHKSSAVGIGWGIADLQQLHLGSSGGVLLTTGNGKARFFAGGPDAFISPARDLTTLVRNPDGTYTRTFKDGTKVNFNAEGFQTSIVDRNDNATSYTYDGSNRLISITDPVGLVTSFTYGANGRLERITDPAGRQTQFQHDAAGNLTRITNPDGTFKTYGYDTAGRLLQAADERANVTAYAYDHGGRFSQSIRPGGETRSLFAARVQGLPNTGAGFGTPANPAPIVQIQDAKSAYIDGRGKRTEYALNKSGQITEQKDGLGQITRTEYDENGNPTKIARPNGAVTTMTYDAKGNLLGSTDPLGATTIFTYEPNFNQVKTIRDPKGNTTTIDYDGKGNPVEVFDALGNRTQMAYDPRGLLVSVTSAVGTPIQTITSFTYDARGNLLTTTNPKADVTTLAYDNAGNVFRSTDAENRVTEFAYDARNRLISVLDADLKLTQYGYDAKGHLTEVRDAKNQTTTFTYDGLDRLVSATNPLGLTENFAYDGNGNLTSTTNRNGQTISFDYDALNRLITKTRPPTSVEVGEHVTAYTYDPVGNLTSVSNPVASIVNQYDAANRLVSTTNNTESGVGNSAPILVPANTFIDENNRQFEGQSLQVNGTTLTLRGSHTFANLILTGGAVLTHSPTTSNTVNKLELTVTNMLTIDPTSRIDASGKGFLGGGKAGNPFGQPGMTLGFQAGSTALSGGSHGGVGGKHLTAPGIPNTVYGHFKNPNEPGSGGAAVTGSGGNGGGIVRIIAKTLVVNGGILANGEAPPPASSSAGGSGGAIRIDVDTLQGAGIIAANGGGNGTFAGGGGGRVAIYYQSADSFNFSGVSSFGLPGGFGAVSYGGAGTVYLEGPNRTTGELIADNGNDGVSVVESPTPIVASAAGELALTHLRARRAARLTIDDQLTITGVLEASSQAELSVAKPIIAATVNLVNGGVLTHVPSTASTVSKLDLSAGTVTIDSDSSIDVSGRGFLGGFQPENPFSDGSGMTKGFQKGSTEGSPGSYGGLGIPAETANSVYGDFRDPQDPGSGGASFFGPVSSGGGLVRMRVNTLQLNGFIRADGVGDDIPARGSGGGIRIDVETISGSGRITALGGVNAGGGRIAIYYQNAAAFDFDNIDTYSLGAFSQGGAGTVFIQGPGKEGGELVITANADPLFSFFASAPESTPIVSNASALLDLQNLRVRRGARVRVDDQVSLSGTLDVAGAEFIPVKRVLAQDVAITNGGVISQRFATDSATFKVDLAADTLQIDSSSGIDVSGRGFLGGNQFGNPLPDGMGMTVGFQPGSTGVAGGSYGGLGGGTSITPETLYTTNKEDGSLTPFLPLGAGDSGEAIAFNPDDGRLYHASGFQNQIFESIDLSSRTTTNIPLTPSPDFIEARALTYWQAEDGFLITSSTSLLRLTPNGVFTFVGTMDHESKGLAFVTGPAGEQILYSVSPRDDQLRIVDPTTAATLSSIPITVAGRTVLASNGLAIDPTTGQLWAVVKLIDMDNRGLVTIDPVTGVAVLIGDTGALLAGVAVDSAGTLYGITGDGQSGGQSFGTPNPLYGDLRDPNDNGSGGAGGQFGLGGSGGGLIRISALNVQLDGVILAIGGGRVTSEGNGGGGSGGGIRIDAGTLSGTGLIFADGGRGDRTRTSAGAGGGGGRIAIYYQDATAFDLVNQLSVAGGPGGITANLDIAPFGEPGTVFTQQRPVAMLPPGSSETAVMTAQAEIESITNDLVHLRPGDVPERRAFDSSMLNGESPAAAPANLYLAMVADGRIKAATWTSVDTQVGGVLETLSDAGNPQSKSENPKLVEDFDPIYSYDLNGNRISMIDPTGLTTYTYDALNRLTSITNNKGQVTSFTYDALGRRTSMTHGNGVVTSYTYDAASQLTRLAHQLGAATVNSFDYTYDKVGNRKTKVDRNGSHNYTYDTLSRLTEALNPLPSNPLENFNYDSVGNRTNSNQNGASIFNQANQLLEDAGFTYQYDNNGNLTRKTPKGSGPFNSYEYDAENKLVRVVINGTTVNYRYDGLGRRVEKEVISVGTTTTRYVYDNEDILLELDGSNNIIARYTHGPGIDEPLILEKGSASFFYQTDGLGSITDITNQSGTAVQRYTHSSFGKIESQLDPSFVQPYTFTAREFEAESGLYYYRARTYNPLTGRFLQEDPVRFTADINFYPLVGNNPVNWIDPEGLQAEAVALGWAVAILEPTPIGEILMAGVTVGAAVSTIGVAAWELYNHYAKGVEKGRNWATERAKAEAASTGKTPCEVLNEMLEAAKCGEDTKQIKDIEQAQKFMGCRNIRKRGKR